MATNLTTTVMELNREQRAEALTRLANDRPKLDQVREIMAAAWGCTLVGPKPSRLKIHEPVEDGTDGDD